MSPWDLLYASNRLIDSSWNLQRDSCIPKALPADQLHSIYLQNLVQLQFKMPPLRHKRCYELQANDGKLCLRQKLLTSESKNTPGTFFHFEYDADYSQ